MSTAPSAPGPSDRPADPWAPPTSGGLPSYPASSGSPEHSRYPLPNGEHDATDPYLPAPPAGRRRKSTGGVWRIVLGIVLVLSTLASVTGANSSTSTATSGDPVATLTVVVLRLLMLGLAVWLIVSGSRRTAEKRRLRRSV